MMNNERISKVKCEAFDLICGTELDAHAEYAQGVVDLALAVIRKVEEDYFKAVPSIEPFTMEFKLADADKDKINDVLCRDAGNGRSE